MTQIRSSKVLVRTALVAFITGIATSGTGRAQAGADIRQLIDSLGSKNEQVMMSAVEALTKRGTEALPSLVDALDKRKECQMQFVASGVLRKIDPSHSRVEPALAILARGECSGNSEQDFVLKQQSAFALSYSVSGIRLLTEMVPHRDVQTRRRVAFAFEDLTEKMNSTIEDFKPSPSLVEPTAEALRKLAPFLDDRDERVRCVTLEALEQASTSQHPSLASAAKTTLAGKRVNCSR